MESARHMFRPQYALALRFLAMLLLGTMTLFIKLLSLHNIGLVESMFYRNIIAIPLIFLYVWRTAGLASLKPHSVWAQVTRAFLGSMGMILTFSAYRLLPLAEATTIGFTSPIFATIIAAFFLHEQVGKHRWSAVCMGFVGVLVVMAPALSGKAAGGEALPLLGASVSLGSALNIAVITILLRQLGRKEAPATTAFWFCCISAALNTPLMCVYAKPVDWHIMLMLLGLGVSGAFGQIALSASVRYAPVSIVSSMDYSMLIWSVLYGWFIFGTLPSASTWLGLPLIILSGAYIAWREHRLRLR
jgi:drug/metabolite transporter (DMT)-like permease